MATRMRRRVRPLTTEEALAILFEEDPDDVIDAVCIPPDVDCVTDEGDVDDNVLAEQSLEKDIANAFELHTKSDIAYENDKNNLHMPLPKKIKMISEGEELIMNNKCKRETVKGNKKKNKSKILPKWGKNVDPTYSTLPSSDEKKQSDMLIEKLDGKSPIEIFEMFMDEKFLVKL